MSGCDDTGHRPTVRSRALWKRAYELIPGGTQLLSRRPSLFAPGVGPMVATRASGATFWDVDGNPYIDMTMSVGAVILGYADSDVDDAVRRQLAAGTIFPVLHEVEIELAELLTQTIPCAEMVRFGKSGGEADAVAVRIARGVTGRDKVAFCGYHGWHDWYLAANLGRPDALDGHLVPSVPTTGVPRALAGTALPFEYNNLGSLERLFDDNPGEIACVIMEPCRSFLPEPGFLEGVRDLTRRHGALLVFDEVVTGFRLAPGGAQASYGVVPDLATFGKAIANGYPLTAVVGPRDVMEPSKDMFISSMYWDDNSTLAAGLACVRKVIRDDVPRRLDDTGQHFRDAWQTLADKHGIHATLKGHPCLTSIAFQADDPQVLRQVNTLYCQELIRRGVFGSTAFAASLGHGPQEMDRVVQACDGALAVLAEALSRGDLAAYLEADLQQPLFDRRMV